MLALYASLDVFVSLHRSGGMSLGLMEAMALGKTGWSGNMSFMDHSNVAQRSTGSPNARSVPR